MRYAIFSDVHANLEALTAVLEFFDVSAVDRYFCLGDTVGYGADPDACCSRVREVAEFTVLGNHDAAVSGRMDYSFYYEAAKNAINWTTKQVTEPNLEWLRSLPYTQQVDDVLLSHGSPLHPEQFDYIFSVDQADELADHFDDLVPITFIGHSHLTNSFVITPEGAQRVNGTTISIESGKKYIVTVGSVGQPRDYNNRACCVIHDTDRGTITFHRIRYNIELAAQKIFDSQLAQSFGKRLFLGI
ncbi:MAG: metallophosphoesterase family protein [Myxococcales bacterium]|nr:metallophosphoesterase family protein [Myxococcales bacterium]